MERSLRKIVAAIKSPEIWLLLLTAVAVSCGEQAVYEEYVAVSEKGWHKDSVINFSVEIEDTTAAYEVRWYLRNNNDYPFSNIYLFREVNSQRGREFADTAQYLLADAYGEWLGEGVGELKTNNWPFKQQLLFFNQAGTYTFTLQQAMRVDYLTGVEDVGLGVFKVNPEEIENGKE